MREYSLVSTSKNYSRESPRKKEAWLSGFCALLCSRVLENGGFGYFSGTSELQYLGIWKSLLTRQVGPVIFGDRNRIMPWSIVYMIAMVDNEAILRAIMFRLCAASVESTCNVYALSILRWANWQIKPTSLSRNQHYPKVVKGCNKNLPFLLLASSIFHNPTRYGGIIEENMTIGKVQYGIHH